MTDRQAINDKGVAHESSKVAGVNLSSSVWKSMELATQPNNTASAEAGVLVMTDPFKNENALPKNGIDTSSELKKYYEKQGAQKDPVSQPGDSVAVPGKSAEPKHNHHEHDFDPSTFDKSSREHYKNHQGIVEQPVPGQRG